MASSSRTLRNVQALRAFAAANVLSYHVLYEMAHRAGYHFSESAVGASGVDLFFVISGFIMMYTASGSFGTPGALLAFLRRRVVRIVPLYWLCTTGVVALLVLFPRLFTTVSFDWRSAVSSYLFLLSRDSAGQIGTVLQTGWTLCFEFYFYLIFAFLLLWPRKVFWLAAASIFGGCIAAGAWSESSIPVFAHVAFNPLLFEFYVGAIIGALYLNGLALPRGIALLVLVLGIAGVFAARNVVDPGGWVRVLSWGSASAAILLGAISLERANWIAPPFAVALGDSSYSLYLTHPFVLPVFGKVGLALGITTVLPPFVFGVVVFLAALTAGHITYHLIERPLTTRLTKPASGLHFAVAR